MPMLILFVLWPVLEISTFFSVAADIGMAAALCLLILAAVAGSWLLRYQGLQTLMNTRETMRQGRLPSQDVFDAACIIGAGILLILPGFLSDFLAFLLLIAPIRKRMREVLQKRGGLKPGDVIDVDFERVDEENIRITKRDNLDE